MKLIIQIPCFNEAGQLPDTLSHLPRNVEGFDKVEWLVIDDGSTDGTSEIARQAGVDHVVTLAKNQGLAKAFMAGLEASLRRGADVIVNTDADNQYDAKGIASLTAPILAGKAQIVVGARPIDRIEHFSPIKRALQRFGSWTVRIASGTKVPDAPSGFRAIHKEAAARLYVFNRYTYTLETIIQAGQLNIPITSVEIAVNPPTRPSRLMRSSAHYVFRSALTILRIFVLYRPFKFFTLLAAILAAPGLLVFARFIVLYLAGEGDGHVQSLVFGAALNTMAMAVFIGGLIADLVAANRALLAEIRHRQLVAELQSIPKAG